MHLISSYSFFLFHRKKNEFLEWNILTRNIKQIQLK